MEVVEDSHILPPSSASAPPVLAASKSPELHFDPNTSVHGHIRNHSGNSKDVEELAMDDDADLSKSRTKSPLSVGLPGSPLAALGSLSPRNVPYFMDAPLTRKLLSPRVSLTHTVVEPPMDDVQLPAASVPSLSPLAVSSSAAVSMDSAPSNS